jgi:hypothetical protein
MSQHLMIRNLLTHAEWQSLVDVAARQCDTVMLTFADVAKSETAKVGDPGFLANQFIDQDDVLVTRDGDTAICSIKPSSPSGKSAFDYIRSAIPGSNSELYCWEISNQGNKLLWVADYSDIFAERSLLPSELAATALDINA